MKRIVTMLVILTMVAFSAGAAPLSLSPLEATIYYPEGADAQDAYFTMTINLPNVVVENAPDEAINAFYDYQFGDLINFTAPLYASYVSAGDVTQAYLNVDYEITYNGDDYFSVLVHNVQSMGDGLHTSQTGHVFSREIDGGSAITLAEMLGISGHLDDDGKLYERATKRANDLVYKQFFAHIQALAALENGSHLAAITMDDLTAEFYPESDFYLTDADTAHFYVDLQYLTDEASGYLTIPLSIGQLKYDL